MSALPPKADIRRRYCDVCFVPKADIASLAHPFAEARNQISGIDSSARRAVGSRGTDRLLRRERPAYFVTTGGGDLPPHGSVAAIGEKGRKSLPGSL
jgi:hypothetical protein